MLFFFPFFLFFSLSWKIRMQTSSLFKKRVTRTGSPTPIDEVPEPPLSSVNQPSRKKRKKPSCLRCCEKGGWVGDPWEKKKSDLLLLGEKTHSRLQRFRLKKGQTQRSQLTEEQRKTLLGVVFEDSGKCDLCHACFFELTGSLFVQQRRIFCFLYSFLFLFHRFSQTSERETHQTDS